MPLLPSTDNFVTVLLYKEFFISTIVTLIFTIGINVGIVYATMKDSPEKWVVFDSNVLIQLGIVHVLMPAGMFLGNKSARKPIIEGKHRPLTQESLRGTAILRCLFFAISIPHWKSRLPMAIVNALLIPMLPMAAILFIACWADLGFCELNADLKCSLTLWDFILLDATWKAGSAIILNTLNYLAVHNDAQEELYENEGEARLSQNDYLVQNSKI